MIVVTGATGRLGSRIVDRLLARVPAGDVGVSVRDPEAAGALAGRGVRVRRGDFTDPPTLAHAFEGADQALVISAAIRGEGAAREIAHGSGASWEDGFDPLRDDPRRAATFNSAMAELTRLSARAVVAGYDFGRYPRVADIGGGYGELLGAVLGANPGCRGVLFDLPHAVEAAPGHLDRMGVRERCEIVGGSFFDEVPGGADLYVLKSVLHDWDDARAAAILATLHRAMGPGARLLLVERLMPERMEPRPEHRLLARADMNMLVAHAAPERTERHWRDLLGGSGFEVVAITPIPGAATAIEAVVAE